MVWVRLSLNSVSAMTSGRYNSFINAVMICSIDTPVVINIQDVLFLEENALFFL
jgi:hypothetical protein